MRVIGVRDAKQQFSKLLRDVRRGQAWVITERGVPVAMLGPMQGELSLAERVRRLEAAGLLEPLAQPMKPLPPPLPLRSNIAQRWLREDRDR